MCEVTSFGVIIQIKIMILFEGVFSIWKNLKVYFASRKQLYSIDTLRLIPQRKRFFL